MSKHIIKGIFGVFFIPFLVCLVVIIVCQTAVVHSSKGLMYSDVETIPHREVGLLLGAPKGLTGRPNPFFIHRIDAAVALYQAGKIDRIIISGASNQRNDETNAMRTELVRHGIPTEIIMMDGKGVRTLASIVRAQKVFGIDSMTVISQKFHNERAIFIAKHNGIDAIAYNATNISSRKWRLLMWGRECLSRVKAVFEVLQSKV
ncbi:MAG: YdcF family protein [Prevotella sp.]|nr:YdcF family protein [Prevotella sp.]